MLNLVEKLSRFLLNIYGGLTLETLSFLKDLLGTLKGIENKESFLLLGFALKGLGTVLLPEFANELTRSLVLIKTNRRIHRLSSKDNIIER